MRIVTADGANAAQGATTDDVVAAGAVGSLSAKLRRLTTDMDAVKTLLGPRAQVAADTATSTANAAAVITYAATALLKHVISGVVASYVGTTPIGTLKIEDVSGTTIFICDVNGTQPLIINFPAPIKAAAVNTALIITLSAGGSGVVAHLNVLGHRLEA